MAEPKIAAGDFRTSADGSESLNARRPAFSIAEVFTMLLTLLVLWFAGKIFLIAFGGLLIAVLLNTLGKWLSRYMFVSYGWALGIAVLAILASTGAVGWLVGSRLVHQANEFAKAVPSALKEIHDYLDQFQSGRWVIEQSPEWGKAIAQGGFPSRITDLASSMIDFGVALVIMVFVGLYCAAEPNLYTEGLLRLVPIARRQRAREVFAAVGYNLRWWLMGQLFAMVCVGVITGVGLWIAGAPLALTLGLLAAILEIVPNIGPVLWLVPAALVALTEGAPTVVHVVMIYVVTHMVESYILIPLVQRRAVLLPPILSILAVVLLGLLAGLLGLVVAAPLALVAMILVKMLYVEDRLGDHGVKVPGEPVHG